jgi:mRNA interferase RelE/StbE
MEIIYLKSFYKDLKKVKDKDIRTKIKNTLLEFNSASELNSIKKLVRLKGHPSAYRIRIGGYRMGLFLQDEKTIVMARFLKRNDIYKLFP